MCTRHAEARAWAGADGREAPPTARRPVEGWLRRVGDVGGEGSRDVVRVALHDEAVDDRIAGRAAAGRPTCRGRQDQTERCAASIR